MKTFVLVIAFSTDENELSEYCMTEYKKEVGEPKVWDWKIWYEVRETKKKIIV